MTQKTILTIKGNLGGDPEPTTLAAKTILKRVYDPLVDDEVERPVELAPKTVYNFSLAVNYEDPETGDDAVRWVHCNDWNGHCEKAHKGMFVAVDGYFTTREGDDGKTYKNFQVTGFQILHRPKAPEVA